MDDLQIQGYDRISSYQEERRSYLSSFVMLLIVILAAGCAYFFYFNDPLALLGRKFAVVYDQLDIAEVPTSFEQNREAARRLDQLRREPCDLEAIRPLAQQLVDAGYPREAAKAARRFGQRCGVDSTLFNTAYLAMTRIGDNLGALEIADSLVKEHPAIGRYRYLRGTAYENLKNYNAALSDYISTLQLFTDLSNVALSEFYRISKMYDATGRPCDAITPLEMFLSYNVAKRQTAQISRIISDYSAKGKCAANHASGADRIIVGSSNIADITINGAKGRVIVDTGASWVSITPAFAARARIIADDKNPITFQAVGGTNQSAPGNAQLITVGNANAANVPVAVSMGNDKAFGPGLDGLLGMTFLARFEVTISNGILDLKPRELK